MKPNLKPVLEAKCLTCNQPSGQEKCARCEMMEMPPPYTDITVGVTIFFATLAVLSTYSHGTHPEMSWEDAVWFWVRWVVLGEVTLRFLGFGGKS